MFVESVCETLTVSYISVMILGKGFRGIDLMVSTVYSSLPIMMSVNTKL